jgi:hypothetical protein
MANAQEGLMETRTLTAEVEKPRLGFEAGLRQELDP